MKSPVTRSRGLAIATVAAFAVALVPVGAATAAPAAKCDNRNNNTISKLLECVDADGAMEHLEAFQAIADANGGNRAAGTSGLRGERRLRRRRPSRPPAGTSRSTSSTSRTSARRRSQQLTPVQRRLPDRAVHRQRARRRHGGRHRRSTCSSALGEHEHQRLRGGRLRRDFPAGRHRAHPARHLHFGDQGASTPRPQAPRRHHLQPGQRRHRRAQRPDRRHARRPERRRHPGRRRELRSRASRSRRPARRRASWCRLPEQRPQKNVIAELPGQERRQRRDGRRAPRLGAGRPRHQRQRQRLRFAARARPADVEGQAARTPCASRGGVPKRAGLLGSQAYVDGLSQAEKDRIALYLNFDMVASPNYIFMVYDGDESRFPAPVVVPEGSVADRGPLRELLHERRRAV